MSFLRFATITKNCGWLVSFIAGRVIDPDEIRRQSVKNYPTKHYAFHRVIPNHIWLQIVAMAVTRHCWKFNWPDGAKRPEYLARHQTFQDLPLPVHMARS